MNYRKARQSCTSWLYSSSSFVCSSSPMRQLVPPSESVTTRYVKAKCLNGPFFNAGTIHPVFSVYKLDEVAKRVAHSAIIANHDVFKSLNRPTLNINRFCGLDSRVNQTLAFSHGMEGEFLRCKTPQIRILHETPGLRRNRPLCNVVAYNDGNQRECQPTAAQRKQTSAKC